MPAKFAFLHSRKFKAFLGLVLISATIFSAEILLTVAKYSGLLDERLRDDHGESALMYADSGHGESEPMGSYFEPSRIKRRLVKFDRIPKVLLDAVIVGEDQAFFEHYGVSPKRIVGAFVANVTRGDRQGGSTITQQLARNMFLSREPTLHRKLAEALLAVLMERRLDKKQIFTMYANEVYLGQRDSFSIHGFGEAAFAYFGKSLEDLTLPEAATLAGIIPAPNAYSPVKHFDRALARRNLILRILRDSQKITTVQYGLAVASELKIAPSLDPAEGHYLVDFIRGELIKDFPESQLRTGSLRALTTVDLELQRIAVDAVRNGLRSVEQQLARKEPERPTSSPQAGLIALDPHTGAVKAMVGGAHYGSSQYNRVTDGFRQPGSVFKPFVYAAALETALEATLQGSDLQTDTITPLTLLMDAPVSFESSAGIYTPRNYRDEYNGIVTLRTAFERSLNVPAVELAELVGFDRVARFARRMGLNDRIQGYPSIALGAFEVTPLEIAGAYTAFANDGKRVEPRVLRQVVGADGHVLKDYREEPKEVLRPEVAYLMTNLMEGVINHGTGAGVRSRGFSLPAAGKTGTSRDGWFAGYTKDLLVIVWVGFDDGRDLNLEGSRSALPIWTEFMKRAYEIHPVQNAAQMYFNPPAGIELVQIDYATLHRATPSCTDAFEEAFLEGTAPSEDCPIRD